MAPNGLNAKAASRERDCRCKKYCNGTLLGPSHGGAVHEHVRVLAIARFPRVIKEMEWFANVLGGGGGDAV